MNPPLRTEKDRQEIIHGLKDGTIDLIATDHAPHSEEEKAKPLTEAPSGITGLETSLGLGITSLVKERYLSLMELLEKMTCNPAFLYKLPGGVIQVNAPADFVIFDPDENGLSQTSHQKPPTAHLKDMNYMEKFIIRSAMEKLYMKDKFVSHFKYIN